MLRISALQLRVFRLRTFLYAPSKYSLRLELLAFETFYRNVPLHPAGSQETQFLVGFGAKPHKRYL